MEIFLNLLRKGRLGYDRVTPYMHCLLYHAPNIIEKNGLLKPLSGQGVEKLNDCIKTIHQKCLNKSNQSHDELLVRNRIEFLHSNGYERSRRQYTKRNLDFWDHEIKEKRQKKKNRIKRDILDAHTEYLKEIKVSEKPVSEMSVAELKEKLKSLGIVSNLRKREKLVKLIDRSAL